MKILPLTLPGVFEIRFEPRRDERGYFCRTYDRSIFEAHGLQTDWAQENQSLSIPKHTLRGLHFQAPPHAETKLVRVVTGAILDVFVDIRKSSPTYGRWGSIELTEDNLRMLYLPRGFAHSFCSISDNATVCYKVDNFYAPGAEGGLRWNDPDLGIVWPTTDPQLSDKDRRWPDFSDFVSPFD